MEKENEMITPTGTCRYCGQSVLVSNAPVGASEHDLDMLATDQCMCPEAQSERRKKERKEKIEKFINKHFDPELIDLINAVILMIEQSGLVEFTCKLPDERNVKIWLDNDAYLRIKIKKTEDEELKI